MEKLPSYQLVAKEIEEKIKTGVYVSSQKLPSEYDLATEFAVSRLTVRKAIDFLIQQNLLFKMKGKGTYVMQPSEKYQSGKSGLVGFTESAKAFGKSSNTKVLVYDQTPQAPQTILNAMQLTKQGDLVYIERLRSFDEEPMTIEHLYVKSSTVKDVTKEQLANSLFELIEKTVEIAYSHQEVEAMLADQELAKLLQIKKNDPVLKVNSIAYSATAIPIIYDTSYYRADKYTFKNTLIRNH
ncbi:GntR family transcriptional regulator, LSA1692 subfamily [Enterococcus sp. LJL90]